MRPLLILVALAGLLVLPAGASASVLFNGNMEGTLSSEWSPQTEIGAAAAYTSSPDPVHGGTQSSKSTLTSGDKRAELQAVSSGTTVKVLRGSTRWFSDSIYLGSGFHTTAPGGINGFQTIMQWKDGGGTVSRSPPLETIVEGGSFKMHGGFGCPATPNTNTNAFTQTLGSATTSTWHNFVFEVYFDTAANGGWVSAWMDGTQILDEYQPPCGTAYQAPEAQYSMLRVGYYRDTAITTTDTIYHDDYAMGIACTDVASSECSTPPALFAQDTFTDAGTNPGFVVDSFDE